MNACLTTFLAAAMLGCAAHASAQKPQPTLSNAELKTLLSKGLNVKVTGTERTSTAARTGTAVYQKDGTARFNEGPIKNGGRRVIFVSGDHSEPNDFVMSVIESFGFAPIYLGGLTTGGRLQQAGGPLAGRDLVDFGSH